MSLLPLLFTGTLVPVGRGRVTRWRAESLAGGDVDARQTSAMRVSHYGLAD